MSTSYKFVLVPVTVVDYLVIATVPFIYGYKTFIPFGTVVLMLGNHLQLHEFDKELE